MGLNAFKDQIVILFSCSGSWGKESFLFSPFELANLKPLSLCCLVRCPSSEAGSLQNQDQCEAVVRATDCGGSLPKFNTGSAFL